MHEGYKNSASSSFLLKLGKCIYCKSFSFPLFIPVRQIFKAWLSFLLINDYSTIVNIKWLSNFCDNFGLLFFVFLKMPVNQFTFMFLNKISRFSNAFVLLNTLHIFEAFHILQKLSRQIWILHGFLKFLNTVTSFPYMINLVQPVLTEPIWFILEFHLLKIWVSKLCNHLNFAPLIRDKV